MFSRLYWLGMGIGSILMIIASWLGLSINSEGYLVNIFTEITSIVVTIFFVSVLLDRYNKYQKKKEWEKARKYTYMTVRSQLITLILNLRNYSGLKIPTDISNNFEKAMDEILQKILQLNEKLKGKNAKHFSNFTEKYLLSIKSNLFQISNIWIPRIIQNSENQHLIDMLIEFDFIWQRLELKLFDFHTNPNTYYTLTYTTKDKNGKKLTLEGKQSAFIYDIINFLTVVKNLGLIIDQEVKADEYRNIRRAESDRFYNVWRKLKNE